MVIAGLGVLVLALGLPYGAEATALSLVTFAAILAVLQAGLGRHPQPRFGLANSVTLVRAAGAALLAGFVLEPELLAGPAGWAAAATAAGLLALDGLDGWAARRDGLASQFGARFDLETDALLILVLAALAFALGKAGPWVLALGLMRYAFVAAGWLRPSLTRPLPPSLRRKAVCVLQVGVLAVLLAPVLVQPASAVLAGSALAALGWSFAVDLRWLLRARP